MFRTCDTIDFGDKSEAAGGAVAFANALEQTLDFLLGVHHRILANVELGWFRPVDLQNAVVLPVPIGADEIKPLYEDNTQIRERERGELVA